MFLSNILKSSLPVAPSRGVQPSQYAVGGVLKRGMVPPNWETDSELPPVQSYIPEAPAPKKEKAASDSAPQKPEAITPEQEADQLREELRKSKENTERDSKRLVEKARIQEQEILAKAAEERQEILAGARNEGYLDGFSKGFKEAQDEFDANTKPQIEAIRALIMRLTSYEKEMRGKYESGIVDTIFTLASKIIKKELQTNPQAIKGLLSEAIERNRREEWIKVTISKELLPIETASNGEVTDLIASMGHNITVEVMNDDGNMCLVETPKGYTEITPDIQLGNLREAVKAASPQ